MKTPINIAEERKKRKRSHRIRTIAIILAGLLVCLGIVLALDFLIRKKVPTRLTSISESFGGNGFPASIPDGSIRDVDRVGKNLVILKDSNLYVYNAKGKQIKNLPQMKERAVMQTNNTDVLVFDIGGREIALHSPTGELFKTTMEDVIITATLGANGEIVVVTWPSNFVAQVTIFNRKYDVSSVRSFSENMVSNAAISTKGQQLAVVTLGSDEGVLDCNVLLYDTAEKEAEAIKIPMRDELVIHVEYLQEDTIAILSDRGYYVYDGKGNKIGGYSFPQPFELLEFRSEQGNMVVMGKDPEDREYIISTISKNGEELGSITIDKQPLDIAIGDKNIYLLDSRGIKEYSLGLESENEYFVADIHRIYAVKDRVYMFTRNEIRILDKSLGA